MRTTLLRFIRNLRRGDQLRTNRKLITLFVCFALSAIFWLMNAYSKVYNSSVSYPVAYVNLPADRVLVNRLPAEVTIMLRAQGFNLLFEKMRGRKDTIYVDVSGLNIYRRGQIYTGLFNTGERITEISRQFDAEVSLLKVIPDTIRFSFADRSSREVPVKVPHRLSFEKQYQLQGNISFDPLSVTVSGPAFILDTLSFIYSDSLVLSGLESSKEVELRLQVPDSLPSLTLGTSTIRVQVPVEKFTEATAKIRLEKVNVPKDYDIRLIPEMVEVFYLVPFSRYDQVNAASFSAIVDFKNSDALKRIPVSIVDQPAYVSVVRVVPSRVEYILRKK